MAADTTQHETDATDDAHAQAETAAVDPKAHADAMAELDRVKKALTETNRKALADRKFREDFEKDQQRKKAEELPELDRLRGEKEEAERRLAEAERRATDAASRALAVELGQKIEREALAQGFESPELAPRLIDPDRVKFDEESGRFEGIKAAVERLAKDYPTLLKAKGGKGSPQAIPFRHGGGDGPARRPQDAPNPVAVLQATGLYEAM